MAPYGAQPFHPDVYVEIDHMADSPDGVKSILPYMSQEMIRTAYAQHNIELHLDTGSMGGLDVIPFDDNLSRRDLTNIYYNYFLHQNYSNWRRGIFHYGIVVYDAGFAGYNFFNGLSNFDCFQISSIDVNKKVHPNIEWRRDIVYASVYMHELGHNVGLNDFAGIDNQNTKHFWQKDWWKYRPYVSVMNYGYTYLMVGYSDGSHGKNDYDDWHHLDLPAFQQNLHWG